MNEPIPYANVVLYALPDSLFVTGTISNDAGQFFIEQPDVANGYLKVSYMGYEPAIVPAGEVTGTIVLKEITTEIGEVVVMVRKPVIRQEAGRLVIGISGTSLSQAGNLMDVFERTPGLQVSENTIGVFGKGTPLIFIDGREIRNNAEFTSLQSDEIASIEIDRNPSARYSASGRAVIRVTTKKTARDRLTLQLYERSYFARKFRNISGLQLNSKWNNTQVSLNYTYSYLQARNYDDAYEINTQPTYTIRNENYSIMDNTTKQHNLFVSLNQQIGKKHTLGAQYSYIPARRNDLTDGDQTITSTNTVNTNRHILNNGNLKSDFSIYGINYEFKIDSVNRLNLLGDYTKSGANTNENVLEENLTSSTAQRNEIRNTDNFDVYSLRADYETRLGKNFPLQTGL
ncbi:MAG: hypothetical protein ACK5HT_05140, partial [Draconibacterium sp.]